MKMTSWAAWGNRVVLVLVACGALMTSIAMSANKAVAGEPDASGGSRVFRRLSPEQYRHIIANVFGSTVKVEGRFEPGMRANGLRALGSSRISVTATGLDQYDAIARSIAAQVVSERQRDTLLPCKPKASSEPDEACVTQFVTKVGRLLYRRPLTPEEVRTQVKVATAATVSLRSFYSGLATSLADMLVSPQFLFRDEIAEADPSHPGQYRLDAFSRASQLSFLFWDAAPDPLLLASAENGELNTQKGLSRQVERLLASPRLGDGIRAFFTDMLGFDEFDTLEKDTNIYPKFTPIVARDAKEQTLRTIVDLLLTRRGDYRDLFTTRETVLTPVLGAVYGVPVVTTTPNGAPETWVPYEYPEGDPRGVGILTHVSYVALHSHPGRSSPTLRGKALREVLLCQKVPDPPGNVNFTVVQDTKNPQFKTARERVTAHRTDPTCAGCHKLIDPMGLAMENFDSSGAYRKIENGATIDASGELDGMKFTDAAGLGKAMHDHPATTSCLVNRLYSYALGRVPAKGETDFVKYLEKSFSAGGYRYPDLLRAIATSDAFYRVAPPQASSNDFLPPKLAFHETFSQENRQ